MFSELLSQKCNIFKHISSENEIGQTFYVDEYLMGEDFSISCRFDSLAYRSREEVTYGARRPIIRGTVFTDYEEALENNYVLEIDTNDDGMCNFQFQIYSVNPVYGFGGMLHHQELEVVDVNYDGD